MTESADHPEKTAAETDLSGRQLGDFRLLRRLGRGAMAEVYLAEQSQLKRRVAVKILRPDLADDRTYLKRFEREAQAAASLVHANIVQIYEVGRFDRLHYIAQEYVQGQNLSQWLRRHGPLDLPRALSIMQQVAAALAKAAEHGVVHRDIKPENIMLTASGDVKVADFGLARFGLEGEGVELTQVGITMGTPLYMSPEQVEGKPLDPRSDLYSFGVTCYQMLAGAPPFRSETALGVAVQHLKRTPEPLENIRPDLPPVLCRLVHKMLAKDAEDRTESAHELLRELRRVQREHVGDAWPEDLPDSDFALQMPPDPRTETTQRLDGLMKTMALQRARTLAWTAVAGAMVIGAMVIGGLTAWWTAASPPLLPNTEPPPSKVPHQSSALSQYLFASRTGTKEAWRAVYGYFPKKKYLGGRAKLQLARIYLAEDDEGDYDRALAIFDEFVAAGDEDPELRACGLAGQYGILVMRGEFPESVVVLDELWPLRYDLRDPAMRKLFQSALRISRFRLEERTALDLDQFLADHFPGGD